jgi:N-acetylmuramoyl-L-alanine amidase
MTMNEQMTSQPPTPANPPLTFSIWTALQTVISVGVVVATLFTLWTPHNLFSNRILDEMITSVQSTPETNEFYPTMTPGNRPRIGIVAGHYGYDTGAVCKDGLTEMDVNLRIATIVREQLVSEGFIVDIFQEYDKRLMQYQALALVSIHNDSCDYINDEATGFKVSGAMGNTFPEKSSRLVACLIDRYKTVTAMRVHYNSITPDMSSYHSFNEIHTTTPAAIIETGFLNLDREILTQKPDLVAKGITLGILCYVRNESVSEEIVTPSP